MATLSEDVFGKQVFVLKLSDGYFRPGAPATPYVNLAAIYSQQQAEFLAGQMGGVVVPCRSIILTEEDAIGVLPLNSVTQPEPIQKPVDVEVAEPVEATTTRRRRS